MLVVLVATLIRSTFGFGEALVAVPLLALTLPIDLAAPLAVLLSIMIAAVVVMQDWKNIHFASAIWLLLPTLLGIPLGITLLTSTHQFIVKAVLGIVIATFSLFALIKQAPELHSESRPWLLVCGFLARCARRRLRHERATTGDVRLDAALVAAAYAGHVAGLFPTGKRCRDVWILARRSLDPCGHALFPSVPAHGGARDIHRPRDESPPARRNLRQICVRRPRVRGHRFGGPGASKNMNDERRHDLYTPRRLLLTLNHAQK